MKGVSVNEASDVGGKGCNLKRKVSNRPIEAGMSHRQFLQTGFGPRLRLG
jgi:hypothetical protein